MPADDLPIAPDDSANFVSANYLYVHHVIVLREFLGRAPTDADFRYPTDGMIVLANNVTGADRLYIRINGVWKSTNLT